MTAVSDASTPFKPKPRRGEAIYRHRLITRITHWINVLCLSLLLMSGLQIFNAHPRLYWGQYGANADPAVMEMVAVDGPNNTTIGVTRIGKLTLKTTGLFGYSKGMDGMVERGFPAWATIPSYQDLADGRRWHFFFAWLLVINGAVYWIHSLISGHLKKDLLLKKDEIKPRHLLRDVWDHIRLKHPTGEAAKRYNSLQKLAYLAVIAILFPVMVLTGLTLQPGMNAIAPILLDLFGGRQSARTIHFVTADLIVLFVIVHLVEVLISGVWNEIRSMITGWYVARPDAKAEQTS